MKLDGIGQVYVLDPNTGDGIAVNLGAVCCENFQSIANILADVFDGKITFEDTQDDSGNTIYTGMKVAFLDQSGNAVIETDLDGSNGKPDFINTGYERIIEFSGEKTGSDSSEAYITAIKVSLVGVDTSSKVAVEYNLGTNVAPSKSPLAEQISGTTQKGIKVSLNQKFGFKIQLKFV
jgi:hypothetical protein